MSRINVDIMVGDCLDGLRTLPARSAHVCVTSPPYFGLRDYGMPGQIGLEQTPDEFVAALVRVFQEVRRVLREDGTLWLNLGDSYAGSWGSQGRQGHSDMASRSAARARQVAASAKKASGTGRTAHLDGIKAKDLYGIPWRVAFALQADGWYLRQDIIWHKPNPMPESIKDRCTKAHEYLFLLSKGARYRFNHDAIAEPVAESTVERLNQPGLQEQAGSQRVPGKTNGAMKAVGGTETRNRRSVWTVPTIPFKESHFATFPPDLIRPCILAGSPPGGVVLDPFGGAGTTGLVATQEGRSAILIELNPEYAQMAQRRIRIANEQPDLLKPAFSGVSMRRVDQEPAA